MKLSPQLKYLLILPLLILLLSGTGCKKKDDMVGRIKVVYSGSTNVIVPDARVELYQNDVKIVGYTNNKGIYEFTFRLKMKLNVSVTKDTSTVTNMPPLKGVGTITMGEYGTDTEETIYLSN